ncbi:hypothetical protein N9B82_00470 [Saprospiraceae bacterium]|nr:hypothetical protein [Saprospiraceae bacterium]
MLKAELYWTHFTDQIKDIAIGNEHPMYGILADGSGIAALNHGSISPEWTKLPFQMSDNDGAAPLEISCGADGSLYAIDENHQFFKFNKYAKTASEAWQKSRASFLSIGVGAENQVYGVGMGGNLYNVYDLNQFEAATEATGFKKVEVATDGTVIGIQGDNNSCARYIVKRDPSKANFSYPYSSDEFSGNIKAIAAHSANQLFMVNENDQIGKVLCQTHIIKMKSFLSTFSVVDKEVVWSFDEITDSNTVGQVIQMDVNLDGVFYVITLLNGAYQTYRVSTQHSHK